MVKMGNEKQGVGTFVGYVRSVEADLVLQLNYTQEQAAACIDIVVDKIQTEYGASSPYIHSSNTFKRRKKVLKIYAETGWSCSKIANATGISERQVFNIIKAG